MFLPRFSGDGNPESWIFWVELYFTYLGFDENDWLPCPSFYPYDETLTWFDGLFRYKLFLDWKYFKGKFAQWCRKQTNTNVVWPLANSLELIWTVFNFMTISYGAFLSCSQSFSGIIDP